MLMPFLEKFMAKLPYLCNEGSRLHHDVDDNIWNLVDKWKRQKMARQQGFGAVQVSRDYL